ncbi:MAG: DUF3180 family protein [Actinobacteria bacterium]|nr:DUF3180 family protein [Actinomycetota bacterium]
MQSEGGLSSLIITPALIVGGFAERMRFSSMLTFSALWLLAIAFVIWGAVLRPRLEARIDPTTRPGIDPLPGLVAARVAAMAMAACRVCAAVAGVYSGIAIATVAGGLATPAASQAFWASVLAASGSGVASAASLRLERSCLLPSGADNDDE